MLFKFPTKCAHISKLFTCDCTNLIKKFYFWRGLKMKWSLCSHNTMHRLPHVRYIYTLLPLLIHTRIPCTALIQIGKNHLLFCLLLSFFFSSWSISLFTSPLNSSETATPCPPFNLSDERSHRKTEASNSKCEIISVRTFRKL